MNKKIICVIDFGQTHLKFNLITEKLLVARTLIFKNNFKRNKNKLSFYDINKIVSKLNNILLKLNNHYNIISLSFVAHGSSCLFVDSKNNIESGFHHNSKFFNKKILKKYYENIPKFNKTFSPILPNFHNMGKNYFINTLINPNRKFMTLISFFGWLFSNKNVSDPSYMSCHTHLWHLEKKNYSSIVRNKDLKFLPKIKPAGNYLFKKDNLKIFVGGHDTSIAFYFHNLFFKKNTLFLSTGTTFVLGKNLNKITKILENSGFYYLCSPSLNGYFLARRFNPNIIIKKNINLLIKKTSQQISQFNKLNSENIQNIVIDGPFSNNKTFLKGLNKANKELNIYCVKNKNSPSIGMAYLCNKIQLKFNNFYKKYNDTHSS